MKTTDLTISSFILSLTLLASCSGGKQETVADPGGAPATEETVTITPEQASLIGIETGNPDLRVISNNIKASGMLDVPPQNLVTINAPLGGFVHETHLLQGTKVKKGEVVVTMRHPDYIQLQQDYLETRSQLEYLESDLKRQEELSHENISAQKTVQLARAEYGKTKARYLGLEAKLRMINLNGDEIAKSGIREAIGITSPITGYVTQVNVNTGLFVAPDQVMFKIVDNEHLHAELQVFEKDIMRVKIGQLIRIHLVNESAEREARVYLIGKEISPERTVRVHGHFDKHDPSLLPGMFFNSEIETGTDKLPSLPETALAGFEGKDYCFEVTGNNQFTMIPVERGICADGHCAVSFPQGAPKGEVVVKGAFTLLGLLKNKPE